MARAHAHLSSGRFAEAVGAFRAVLAIDASTLPARLGLADAMAARGHRAEAIEGLIEAAEKHAELDQPARALTLYGKALALDPCRMELHLDVAMAERAMGRHDAALARVEGLAERYMTMGRTDEAAELLRFVATWDETIEELELEPELEEASTVSARRPAPQLTSETVICATVLIRPDGTLWLDEGSSRRAAPVARAPRKVARVASAPIVLSELPEVDPDMVTRVDKLRVARAPRPIAAQPVGPSARPRATTESLVERLRKRAGLVPEAVTIPRSTTARGAEPIEVRRPPLPRAEREREEVTHRFRRPRRSEQAAAC